MSSPARPGTSPSAATPVSPAFSQRSGYPFPDIRHPTTPTSRYPQRRSSLASTASATSPSIGGSLDIQPRRTNTNASTSTSTLRETSQNAISTLLQPPIVRTGLLPGAAAAAAASGYKAPSQKDIPPVALTNIDHIPTEHFRDYLSRIAPLFESLQRGRSEPEGAQWLKKDAELERTDRFAEALERRWSSTSIASPAGTATPLATPSTTAATFSPLENSAQAPQQRRRSNPNLRRNRHEPTPLSTIPPVYFEADFHLENPRTFDIVSERAEILRPLPGGHPASQPDQQQQQQPNGAPRKALATNAVLQEKLSWYMDTVEVHLINSVSAASSGFFAALGGLRELQGEAEESVARIRRLRADLKRLDAEVAVKGLEVEGLRRRRGNLERLARAAGQVGRVVRDVQRVEECVEAGELEEAAERMEGVGRLVCGRSPSASSSSQEKPRTQHDDEEEDPRHLIDLRPLKALQGLDTGLQDLQLRIGAGFSHRFTTTLLTDLRTHVDAVPAPDTLKRWSRHRPAPPPKYLETTPEFRRTLLSALEGLQRAGHIAPATTAYREAVAKEMKGLIRRSLPSSSDDDADSMVSSSTRGGGKKASQVEKSSILARNLRALDAAEMERLLVRVYTDVGEGLRRLATQGKILIDVGSSMLAPPTSPGRKSSEKSPPSSPPPPSKTALSPRLASLDSTLASAAGAKSPPPQQQQQQKEQQQQDDPLTPLLTIPTLLDHATDTAQTQLIRILKVLHEPLLRLSPARFLRFLQLSRLFADECEAVSGRAGQALRGVVGAQAGAWVAALGAREVEKVAAGLDAEAWAAGDFGEALQVCLGRVVGSVEKDPAEWGWRGKEVWEEMGDAGDDEEGGEAGAMVVNGTATVAGTTAVPNGQPPAPSTTSTTTATTATPAKTTARPADLDGSKYHLVPTAAGLLPTLESFLSLLTTPLAPSLTPQIATALLDLLRTFNSRSCQLILGAGATRSAGLKNITTKHLALASQALSFVVALVPYLRECVRRHLPAGAQAAGAAAAGGGGGPAGVLAEFEKVKRLYLDHQAGIRDKLVEIMTGRSLAHVRSMKSVDFDSVGAAAAAAASSSQEATTSSTTASPYVETLTKETTTLHRVLSRHLSEMEVGMIMGAIFDAYREQWTKAFSEVEVKTEKGMAVLRRDAEVLVLRLGKVEGFGRVGEDLLGAVQKREGEVKGAGKVEEKAGEKVEEGKVEEKAEEVKVEGQVEKTTS